MGQAATLGSQPRVLITGAQGFTGHYVAAELRAHGWEVWGVGSHAQPEDACYRQADLLDADGLKCVVDEIRPQAVVHLAAIAFVGHGDAGDFYRVNVVGTRNLLEALAPHAQGLRCVLLASSANVYGNATEGVLDEATPPDPVNDYAVSKLAMEWMARLWLHKLPLVVVRPFNYTGVGQSESFLVPKIVGHFKRREPMIELGNLDVWRDFSDVRTVAFVYRRLLELAPAGKTFNVGSGRTHSLRDVLALAAEASGHQLEVKVNPAFVRASEVRSLCADTSLLRATIGPWPEIPLADTIRWMLDDR